jgi:transcriptional accessory protein Tex/SPT6
VHSIVSEAGASIYSASADAEKELPYLDVTVRGAGKHLINFCI